MSLAEQVKNFLSDIKSVKGVENAVLTQRDGNPIQSVGVWLSQDEVFKVCAATSAIYNCGIELHHEKLKYILIEGQRAKILLAPLRNTDNKAIDRIAEAQGILKEDDEFYIAITTTPTVNLGGILLKTRESLVQIKKALIMSGENFKPPLRHFSQDELTTMMDSFNLKDDTDSINVLNHRSLCLDQATSAGLENVMKGVSTKIMDLDRAFLTADGGFIVNQIQKRTGLLQPQLDSEASMSYSLFATSDQCAWFLKKMQVTSILLECNDQFQFIHRVRKGIFSVLTGKDGQKLGLLRMLLPKYIMEMEKLIDNAVITKDDPNVLDLKALFQSLVIQ